MIDEAGAATAAAEPSAAAPADGSQPSADAGPGEQVIDRSKETARASVDRAFAEVDAKAALLDLDPDALKDREDGRDEKGRFKAKDAQPVIPQTPEQQAADKALADKAAANKGTASITEAPSRFSPDAKAAWASVPDPVKGEVHRAFQELETGLNQYQQFFEPLKPFYQLAQKHETTVHDTLGRYVSLDMQLISNEPEKKFAAIEEVLEYAGISPKEYAALVMGQKPEQAQVQSAAEIRQLKGEIAELKQMLGGVSTTLAQSREKQIEEAVNEFTKTHPRMEDAKFTQMVTRLLNTQMADSLESAYNMADRFIPAPVTDTQQHAASNAATTAKPSDQTRKGQLSVAGPPVSGSNPQKRKPASSTREALDRSFAEVGIG